MSAEEKYQWLTTVSNPRRPATGFDAGVTGWKLHAVEVSATDTAKDIGRRLALCGMRPRYGWGLDLFIEDECAKCLSKIENNTR